MSDKTAPPQESLEETYLWFDSETRIKKTNDEIHSGEMVKRTCSEIQFHCKKMADNKYCK
jgi:hypothetical protein